MIWEENSFQLRYINISEEGSESQMKRKRFWMILICLLLVYTNGLAQTAYVNGKNADRVHLRNAPSQDSESMGLFYTGTAVELDNSSFENEWVRVNIGAMHGYMMNDYLQKERPSSFAMPAARVKSDSLNLRSGPSKQTKVLRVLEEADKLIIMGQSSNDWYYVMCSDGTIGYVMPEYVSLTGENVSKYNADIRKIGETFDGYFIYSWPAPNGQTLYFTGLEDPGIIMEDVNFDGHEDVVVTIIRGASNFFSEFFVWDDGSYVRAGNDGLDYGLCNYHLYPEYGIVHSDANNGNAGALHEDVLFRWEGTELKAIRRAVSEEYSETTRFSDGNGYTTTYDFQNLRVRVWDYSKDVYEGELIYDDVVSLKQINNGDDYNRAFAGEQEALWRCIK